MYSIKKAIIYGFFVWLIPFLASFPIFSLRETNRALFESIMPVILVLVVVVFAAMYLLKIEDNHLREAIGLGIIFLVISLAVDLFMFMWGPMKMTLVDYLADIGLTYLIIPIITISFGYLRQRK